MVFGICGRTDVQTSTQTHMLMTVLRKRHWNEVIANGGVGVHENLGYFIIVIIIIIIICLRNTVDRTQP